MPVKKLPNNKIQNRIQQDLRNELKIKRFVFWWCKMGWEIFCSKVFVFVKLEISVALFRDFFWEQPIYKPFGNFVFTSILIDLRKLVALK